MRGRLWQHSARTDAALARAAAFYCAVASIACRCAERPAFAAHWHSGTWASVCSPGIGPALEPCLGGDARSDLFKKGNLGKSPAIGRGRRLTHTRYVKRFKVVKKPVRWNSNRPSPLSALRSAAAEGQAASSSREPWTRSKWFASVMVGILLSNIVALIAESMSWIGPDVAAAFDKTFVCAFTLELVCRLNAGGLQAYFASKSNWFDFIFVAVYTLEVAAAGLVGPGLMSALRVARFARGLGVIRRSLQLIKVLNSMASSPAWLTRLTGVLFFVAVSAEFKVLAVQSVVGMLGIFGALLVLQQRATPEVNAAVYSGLEPGKAFLVKWATLFFAPALVRLPLVEENFEAGTLVRLAVLLLGGFLGTLLSTAGIASLFPAVPGEEPAAQPPAPRTAAAPVDDRPYKKRLLPAYAGCMVAGTVAARLSWAPAAGREVFMLGASLLGFVVGMLSPKWVQSFVHPMFACILTTWLAAALWGALAGQDVGFLQVLEHYSTWPGAGAVLSFLLGPTVIALGVLLFERRRLLLRELWPMIATAVLTSLTSLFFTAFLARALGLPSQLAVASLLRCISSPFAGDLAGLLGASPTFAIAMIVLTGFIGVVLGQPIFKVLRLRNPRTRGLSMGAASHGLGTVALAASDPDAFPYSALGFVLVGTATSTLLQVPLLRAVLLQIVSG
uniref:Ion transport domain-containing protein n=1 Tax=Pyrodinium bahamense TaxID=73915 RepID=A0A7S0ABX2_9DINO|mmetsp:Transcript_29560/g.81230  ORF Transcript_29560/g.81230 Transcript_29560/m.81230 type:complete len:674 (+) Transcript_29560:36-2057(+)